MVFDSVNPFEMVEVPHAVDTDTFPPPLAGTMAEIAVGLTTEKFVAGKLLKFTCDTFTKAFPVIFTRLEAGPAEGVTVLIDGAACVDIVILFDVTVAELLPVRKIIFGLLDPVAVPVVWLQAPAPEVPSAW